MKIEWTASEWSALAAGLSALSALIALIITINQADTPYQQSLYQERWRAYNEFARSSSHLSGVMANAEGSITNNLDSETGLAKMKASDFLKASDASSEVLKAHRAYTETTSGIAGPWPTKVVQLIDAADHASMEAVRCDALIGGHGLDMKDRSDWWAYVRDDAATTCKDYHKARTHKLFDVATSAALGAMAESIRRHDSEFTGHP